MSDMERGSIDELVLEARKRGMSYGKYVAARFYPVAVEEHLPDGGLIRRVAALPPVISGWERPEGVGAAGGSVAAAAAPKAQKEKPKLLCVVCGTPLRANYRKYCSEECRMEAKRAKERKAPAVVLPSLREDKPCVICGKTMHLATRLQRYCGPECRRIGTARRQREWNAKHPPEPKPPRRCRICGARIDGNGKKYCSSCAAAETARRNRERWIKK